MGAANKEGQLAKKFSIEQQNMCSSSSQSITVAAAVLAT